jgi:hypothetical protein
MGDTPLFEDTSFAGHDHAAHAAFILYAELHGADPTNPADQLIISQHLKTWLEKLERHARPRIPADHDPLEGQPF